MKTLISTLVCFTVLFTGCGSTPEPQTIAQYAASLCKLSLAIPDDGTPDWDLVADWLDERNDKTPPADFVEFHAVYVANVRWGLDHPEEWVPQDAPNVPPELQTTRDALDDALLGVPLEALTELATWADALGDECQVTR